MTRFGMSGVAVVALVLGALLGFLGAAHWSRSRQGELNDALEKSTSLERRVKDLRAENDRIGVELQGERARGQTIAADLQREKETNMRLQMLVSGGKK